MSKILITGVTGQVGSYLAEELLARGNEVHGLDRRKSVENRKNIRIALQSPKFHLIEGELTDSSCMTHIIQAGQYDYIYNLAAQSHVHTSYEQPAFTLEVNTLGVLNILEAMRRYSKYTVLYQASTSEMFGNSLAPQNECTPFAPRSPYGVSKLAAHLLVRNYREGYGLNAACGIMFNTESPRRGDNFVTKKITNWFSDFGQVQYLAQPDGENVFRLFSFKPFTMLELGNIYAKRDWSYVTDSVDAIIRIAEQRERTGFNTMRDYCFGSGNTNAILDFILECIRLWAGNFANKVMKTVRVKECGEQQSVVSMCGLDIIRTVPKFFRPTEVSCLCCDHNKITRELGWQPKVNFRELVKLMMPPEVKT